jgi:hypothetical protein
MVEIMRKHFIAGFNQITRMLDYCPLMAMTIYHYVRRGKY